MSGGFDLPLLQAISDWQRGGNEKQSRRRGAVLKDACAGLPEKYRTCGLCCFRQIALPKGGVWNLIGEDKLPEKISSWTTAIEIAKAFKNGVPPEGQGYQGVILYVHPKPEDVIVNLSKLYQEPAFTDVLEQNKASISGYHEGVGLYANSQIEVVLEIATVTQQDIYSIGGHSSEFEQLVDIAAEEIYGTAATARQREELLLKSEQVRSQSGPCWLRPEATQRVLDRLKPEVEQLRKIKRQQESG